MTTLSKYSQCFESYDLSEADSLLLILIGRRAYASNLIRPSIDITSCIAALITRSNTVLSESHCSITAAESVPGGFGVQCAGMPPTEVPVGPIVNSETVARLSVTAKLKNAHLPDGFADVCVRDAILTQEPHMPVAACVSKLFIEWHTRRSTICVRFSHNQDARIVDFCASDLGTAVVEQTSCDTTAASEVCW